MARFEIIRRHSVFYFRFVGSNQEVIASSEAYTSKQGAMNGIEAVRSAAAGADVVDLTVAKNETD
jgi:uncharacterized protein